MKISLEKVLKIKRKDKPFLPHSPSPFGPLGLAPPAGPAGRLALLLSSPHGHGPIFPFLRAGLASAGRPSSSAWACAPCLLFRSGPAPPRPRSRRVYTKIWKKNRRDSKAPRIMSSRNQLRTDRYQLIQMQHWDRLCSDSANR